MKIFQVDAFTKEVFSGNPAAIVPLQCWLSEQVLQAIAQENNLAETAFLVPDGGRWQIRWFTPTSEVALCGHATLASAHVLFKHLGYQQKAIEFETRESGLLSVTRLNDGAWSMSFPAISTIECDQTRMVALALGAEPSSVLLGRYSADQFDYVAVFESEEAVSALKPDFAQFRKLDSRGVIASAQGKTHDFVSRYFAPNIGIEEDPVTGSAHCLLTPYWSNVLDKQVLQARQISPRGGDINCTMETNDRVLLAGYAVDYLVGEIQI